MFTLGSRWVNSSNRTLECGYIHKIILVIILYSVVNYYDMICAVTILDIYYVCNYSLGAC